MTAAWVERTVAIRIDKDVRAELAKIQQEVWEEHRARINVSDVIRGLLAGRKPVQP